MNPENDRLNEARSSNLETRLRAREIGVTNVVWQFGSGWKSAKQKLQAAFHSRELIKKRAELSVWINLQRERRGSGGGRLGKKLRSAFEPRLSNRILVKRTWNRYRESRGPIPSYANNYNRADRPRIFAFKTIPLDLDIVHCVSLCSKFVSGTGTKRWRKFVSWRRVTTRSSLS